MKNARLLSSALEASGWYTCVSDIHRKKGVFAFDKAAIQQNVKAVTAEAYTTAAFNAGLPVVAFRLSDDFKKQYPHVKQVAVSNLLRAKQYIIPSKLYRIFLVGNRSDLILPDYPLPPNEEKIEILRVVVRESMSRDLLDRLITDIFQVTETLMETDATDLQAYQPSAPTSIEKKVASKGHDHKNKHKASRPMSEGVHRSVC